MEPVIASGLLQSKKLVTNATNVLKERCVAGIIVNVSASAKYLGESTALAIPLVMLLRHEKASDLPRDVIENRNGSLRRCCSKNIFAGVCAFCLCSTGSSY